jgi:hypothetical protein
MTKPFETPDGKKFTNADTWRQHKASLGARGGAKGGAGVLEPEEEQAGEMQPHHAAIHEHLQNMHAQTGEAHSHVEHHGDGTHTLHHVDQAGEMHGPHDHENLEELKGHMDKFLDEEGQEGEGGEEEGGYQA